MRLPAAFHPPEYYREKSDGYRLLPFRFMRQPAGRVFVSNEVGEYHFLNDESFRRLVAGALPSDDPDYLTLRSKHIIWDSKSRLPLELLATKYRTRKDHLRGFTKLHMFVVTLRCDHSCKYCQVSRVTEDRVRFDMSAETARRSLDLVFSSPAEHLKIEFQGGEPLLNFERVREIVELALQRNQTEHRLLDFVVATNLVPLTDDMLYFFKEHAVSLSTSLDGPEQLHNANRPRPGNDSHRRFVENLARARAILGADRVSALMTTTARSLQYPHEVVEEYVRLGFDGIFLRPISPYGFASKTGEAARYQNAQFLDFYRAALAYIIETNRGGQPLVEAYSQLILTKLLTPFSTGYVDLQSPAGAGIACVAYNYDGRVFASDEARMLSEMNDDTFCLGRVEDGYKKLFRSPTTLALAAGTILEALPACSDCAFLPYCGADPIFNYRTQGDIVGHKATSAFCERNMGVIQHLLDLLHGSDTFTRDLLTSWGTGVSFEATN